MPPSFAIKVNPRAEELLGDSRAYYCAFTSALTNSACKFWVPVQIMVQLQF